MGIYKAGENYLEAILILREERTKVRAVDMSRLLNVTKASVSKTLKALMEDGYVNVDLRAVTLTEEGEKVAVKVHQKRNVLQKLLTEVIGIDKKVAESEAAEMKHAISDKTLTKIQSYIKKNK
ncbi:MAG: metal-dependent transcriptional regulator [Filifactoraceae bacterium]